ncbi:MAG: hypothetical protein ACOC46_01780, partial [Pirellulales bacterium]
YTWPFGTEPIAGVTPFVQMRTLSGREAGPLAARRRARLTATTIARRGRAVVPDLSRALVEPLAELAPRRLGAAPGDMVPLKVPLSAAGFTPQALEFLADQLQPLGLVPAGGGTVTGAVAEEVAATPLAPGAPLGIALVTGDLELTGMGTVTEVEGERVYGWGHPFLGFGATNFPMLTGYIHTVYPRQSVSMKLGSGVETLGTIDADVSTGVAGRLGVKPDLLPVTVHIARGEDAPPRTYRVQVVREPMLLTGLVATVLGAAVEAEGGLPDEPTLVCEARVAAEGHEPLVLDDVFADKPFQGTRTAGSLFAQVAGIAESLARNPFEPVRLQSIEARIRILDDHRAATIESVALNNDRFEPGETLVATAVLQPHKGRAERVALRLKLPDDLPPGRYEAVVCDSTNHWQRRSREESYLREPNNFDQMLRGLRVQLQERRTNVYLRVTLPQRGVALHGVPLPALPSSARSVLESDRRTARVRVQTAAVARCETPWAVTGSDEIPFEVIRPEDAND